MKINSSLFYVLTVAFLFCSTVSFSQKSKAKPLDPALEANIEKWKVKEHKGLFGIAKPEFGNYTTLVAEKMDSPVIRKKVKDSLGKEVSFSGDQGWDIGKYVTFKKKKFYRMVFGKESDTTEIQFYVQTISSEKRQTVIGKMLSKSDEGKDAVLNYQKFIAGFIIAGTSSNPANFFMEDYVHESQVTNNTPEKNTPVTNGYILIGHDSLFTEPIMQSFGNPKNKLFFFQWQDGIYMNDVNGRHIAVLLFDNDQPFYITIQKDLQANYQEAMAAFFAVIIGVKDL